MIMPRGAPHSGNGLHSGTNVEFVEVLDMWRCTGNSGQRQAAATCNARKLCNLNFRNRPVRADSDTQPSAVRAGVGDSGLATR